MLSLAPLSAAYPLPFPPPVMAKRANTLLLKHKLADLLTPAQGEAYWSLLCNLLTGRITREEFDIGWAEDLSEAEAALAPGELEFMHNSLLFSILYNTSKPTLPPAGVSHQGWNSKRKRDVLDAEDAPDPLGDLARKRRRIKALVNGMTKVEKKRLKNLLFNKKEEPLAFPSSLAHSGWAPAEKTKSGLMPSSAGLKPPNSAALQQDLSRVSAAPSCTESKELPDIQTLNDRMAALAYANNLSGGVDLEAAGLASVALHAYMKDLLTALVGCAPQAAQADPVESSTIPSQPLTLTKDNLLDLLGAQPTVLHTSQLGSVERFFAHQHLYSLPPPTARVRKLERNVQQRAASLREKEGSRTTKSRAFQGGVSDQNDGDVDMDLLSRGATSQNMNQDMSMDGSLEAELFPDLPASEKSDSQVPRKPKAPVIDISSSEDEIELSKLVNTKASSSGQPKQEGSSTREESNGKNYKGKGREVEEKPEKGRLGVWKLLSGILEAHAPGQPSTALHHRSPHYGFHRGRSYN